MKREFAWRNGRASYCHASKPAWDWDWDWGEVVVRTNMESSVRGQEPLRAGTDAEVCMAGVEENKFNQA